MNYAVLDETRDGQVLIEARRTGRKWLVRDVLNQRCLGVVTSETVRISAVRYE